MEFEEQELLEPMSPSAQYLNSSALSLIILGVLESEVPIDDSQNMSFLKDVFLPINPCFSSVMTRDKNGEMKWKRVDVNLIDHVKKPIFPEGKSREYYDACFSDYMTKLGMEQFPQNRPLWEIHLFKYPTSNAEGNVIFKLHHALGDGYSLMGALLSCLQRVDDPSLPLTFPSRQPTSGPNEDARTPWILKRVQRLINCAVNSILDSGWSLLKSTIIEDDRTPIRSGDDGVEFRPISVTTMTFSLDHIKQIKSRLKVTINDVMTGIVIFGARLYMQGINPQSSTASTTALVLFNTRQIGGYQSVDEMIKPNAKMPWGNHFAFLHVSIPKLNNSKNSKPQEFIQKVHQTIKRKRNSASVYLNGELLEFLRKINGPEATARFIHSTIKNSTMGISNLIGPVEKMALANHPVKSVYFAVAGPPQSLGITMVSYVGKLRIALTVEKGFIDPQKLKSCIKNAFEIMYEATMQSAPPANL